MIGLPQSIQTRSAALHHSSRLSGGSARAFLQNNPGHVTKACDSRRLVASTDSREMSLAGLHQAAGEGAHLYAIQRLQQNLAARPHQHQQLGRIVHSAPRAACARDVGVIGSDKTSISFLHQPATMMPSKAAYGVAVRCLAQSCKLRNSKITRKPHRPERFEGWCRGIGEQRGGLPER